MNEIREVTEPTIQVLIFVAGDMVDIRRACRSFVMRGLCVSVEATSFIYTGGAEEGALVRLVNYPRFPKGRDIANQAKSLAHYLIEECHQESALIVADDTTTWLTRRPND